MRKQLITALLAIAGFFTQAQDLKVIDSAAIFKRLQKIETIEKRLADNRARLDILEKDLVKQTEALDNSLMQSQASANKNRDAADRLQDNTNNKKAAKRAAKAARKAQKAAKRARKADSRKTSIEKDIRNLRKKIDKDEKQLEKLNTEV